MDGQAGLGGREQLQGHVELRRTKVAQALCSTRLRHLRKEMMEDICDQALTIEYTGESNNVSDANPNLQALMTK